MAWTTDISSGQITNSPSEKNKKLSPFVLQSSVHYELPSIASVAMLTNVCLWNSNISMNEQIPISANVTGTILSPLTVFNSFLKFSCSSLVNEE